MSGQPQPLLLLLPLAPLAAALLGYVLHRRGMLAGWLGITGLLASAIAATMLLGAGSEPATYQFGTLSLPESQAIQIDVARLQQIPRDAETRVVVLQEMRRASTEYPLLVEIPLALIGHPGRLLFALSCALIAALCLAFGLRERAGDPRRGYFCATLTLFSAAMLLFVTADTLLLMFVAWELMGLCSFLLIGYNGTPRARRAAREAFWTTRATDFCLLFAVIILTSLFQWPTFSSIESSGLATLRDALAAGSPVPPQVLSWLGAAGILVLIAALGKLAAFPLSFWLAEAMVAPPAVSALLHAATMVAAGPFLMLQLAPLYSVSQVAMLASVILGGITLVVAGIAALSAADAKRALAFSTSSQLAIPVIAVGVFAQQAGYFHLLAHAWLKAPLFLAVGYLAVAASRHAGGALHVAQHSGSEDDPDDHTLLTRLAGTARRHPLALGALVLGGLGLAGVAFSGGFFGKEQLLLALSTSASLRAGDPAGMTHGGTFPLAAASWRIGAVLLLLSIPLTAAYTARLIGLLGWGRPATPPAEVSANQPAMRGWQPILALSLLAAFIGAFGFTALLLLAPATLGMAEWKLDGPAQALLLAADIVLVLAGGLFAWWFNVARPGTGAQLVRDGRLAPLIGFFDAALQTRRFWLATVGHAGALLARLSRRADERIIDQLALRTGRGGRRLAALADWVDRHVVDGLRYWACEVWWILRRLHRQWLQTGYIQHYMLVILVSAVILCFIILRPLALTFGHMIGRL